MANKFEVLLTAKLDDSSVKSIQTQINNILKNKEISVKTDTKQVNNLTKSLQNLNEETQNAKNHTQGLGEIMQKFAAWSIGAAAINGVKNAMRDMVDEVFELDNSLVELDKVTDLTSTGLQDLADDAFAVGEQIGATGKDVIDATTIFAQAGYEAQEALDLAEQAIMLKNVSEAGATAAGSAETLISTLKGFSEQGLEASHITDALNEVSNKYAVSVNDLSTGVAKASAAMASSGNTFEEMMGLLTAGTEVMQQPGKIANALSTISARLTADNDEYIASITGGMGTVDDYTGELRSTYDILKDLAEVYPKLTSVQKQEMVEVVAGKTQRTALTSILSNFESAIGATEAALNSEGSAAAENAKRMESLEGKLTRLQSSWQSFSRNTIDTDFVKNLLDVTNGMINFVDSIGGLPTILSVATASLLLFKGGLILDKSFNAFNQGIELIRNGLDNVVMAIPNAISGFKAFSSGIITASTAIQAAVPLLSLIALGITGVVAAINYYNKAQKEATEAAIESSKSSDEIIKNKIEEKNKIEDEINSLEEEKEAIENNSKATENSIFTNEALINSKQDEIDKRKENIKAIEEEIAKELKQREAAARSITFNDTDWTGLGWNQNYGVVGSDEETTKLRSAIKDINEELKTADGNTGAYNRKLEELREKYETIAQEREANGEQARAEEEIIKALNKEIEENSEKYEEDKKSAAELYDILLDGGKIEDDKIDWLRDFYDLNEEEINQLQNGNDVLAEQNDTYDDYSDAIEKASEAENNYNSILDSNIQKLVDYSSNVSILTEAQDMLTDSGHLTAEMFQQLKDNDLIQYLELVDGKLQVNKDAFDASSQAAIDNATQAVKNSVAQQLLQIALADQNGTLSETANELGYVTEESKSVETTNAVNEILKIGSAASISKGQLGALFKTMENGEEVNPDYNPSAEAQNLMNQVISNANKQIAAINAISLNSFKSSGSSSSKKKSSSSRDEYKAEIDSLYQYENALDNAKDAVDRLEDALDGTENFNEQEKYIREIIDALNNQINKTNELKNAQVGQINDYINQLRAQGFAIDYNSDKNELYINNMQHLADFTGDAAKSIEEMIDKIQELNDDNRDLDGSIRDLTGDVKDYYSQLEDIPEEKLEKFNELMEEFQQSQLDQVQNQIDDLQHEMDNDPKLKALEEQIEALKEQNDELDKQKELEEKILAVEEAKEKLENARNQKTLQVYTADQGWVWQADPDEIADAEEELKDAQEDLDEALKDDEIDRLEEEKEAIEKSYQDRIDALEDFLEEQEYLIDVAGRESVETLDQLKDKLAEFGLDTAENLAKVTEWLDKYNEALNKANETLSDTISLGSDKVIYSSDMQSRINSALSGINPSIDRSGITKNINYETLRKQNSSNIYIDTIQLPNVKNADDFVEALKNLPGMAISQSSKRK